MIKRLPSCVTRELGYYVYLYVDPETDEVFYVGKGKGNRLLCHVDGRGKTPHGAKIRGLRKRGLEPRVEVLIHGLKDEKAALAVEMAAIDLVGLDRLSNRVHGHHSSRQGRMSLDQVLSLYQRKPARITEPVMLIRISRMYHYGISEAELYDATRGVWVVGTRREKARYALAVYRDIVREVYAISQWLRSGSTFNAWHHQGHPMKGRWEFVGTVALDPVRRKYLGRSVDGYFSERSRNPIQYVNC
ncbi:MAG TPA: hypothetical protein VM238_02745 [Phycisphaerae bacterium]|nr:hypothetical protein [Phycisphaerae bacterium]